MRQRMRPSYSDAMTTTTFELMLATKNDIHRLEVWENPDHELRVVLIDLLKDKVVADQTFRDCETQHHDSERWLNDQVGYPNQFAGFLSARIWEHV